MRIEKQILGREYLYGGNTAVGWLPPNAARPLPTPQRMVTLNAYIVRGQHVYHLLWRPINPIDSPWIDDWDSPHESVEQAQWEAQVKYGIAVEEWNDPPTPGAIFEEKEP